MHGDQVSVLGPDLRAQPIEDLSVGQATRHLQSVLDEPDSHTAYERSGTLRKALNSTGIAGFTNSGLFASHHVSRRVPERSDWAASAVAAQRMLPLRGRPLIEALGFMVHEEGAALVLSGRGEVPRAVAVLLDETEAFDSSSPRFQLSPVAFGLAEASRRGVNWLVVLRRHQIRLYPARTGVGVGQKGQVETFFEIDLAAVSDEHAAFLPLVFAEAALRPDGSVQQILDGSARYATELGERLRERIYDNVVPPLARALAARLPELGLAADEEGLRTAYRLTLRILFRLLFQAYAEDRGLLPSGRNEHFDSRSLKTAAQRYRDSVTGDFSATATGLWADLEGVWQAIDQGNEQWSVPAYNGGLFSTTQHEGAHIARLTLPDAVVGPLFQALLVDVNRDGERGPVDFRSLNVREFGTIYEGLLESSLSIADIDLAVDPAGGWVPARAGDTIAARAGEPYFHSSSGERKATGSYFTPPIVVDHLIERSIVPTLTAHLDRIAALLGAGDTAAAGKQFFDYRVADLAMGSGHFLVAAIDRVEALYRDFLTTHSVPSVQQELVRIAEAAKRALGKDLTAIAEIEDVALLRRQVARRCIYGIDINPLALELSRLALWIHTFVPGLPMSSFDHNLVCANSLTGIGTVNEALVALEPGRKPGDVTLVDGVVQQSLEQAAALWSEAANADEADKAGVETGTALAVEARRQAAPAGAVLDLAVAVRSRVVAPMMAVDADQLVQAAAVPEVQDLVDRLKPAHLPHLFPEVFMRERPGFDVLVGNPPWEKLHVEEHQWWALRLPGLRGLTQARRQAALAGLKADRPDLLVEFRAEVDRMAAARDAIAVGPFPGIGAAHLDLYAAFAWRNWQLVRPNGRAALVLPRGALSGSGLQHWRREILSSGAFADVCFLANNGGWLFEGVHNSYTVGLTVLDRSEPHVVRFAGPFASEREFVAGATQLAEVSGEEFATWSSTAAFPLVPDPTSAEVFGLINRQPEFGAASATWEFRPIQGDVNTTSNKSLLQFDVDEALDRIPVISGASFNLWDPGAGPPYAYAQHGVLRPYLQSKLDRAIGSTRSAYADLMFSKGQLPLDRARIAFRDVARATDTRTVIACMLPPGTAAVHTAPILVSRRGGPTAEAFLLGVMSSIVFDWAARRWVELHLTFELLNALPVPHPDDGRLSRRVIEISGRLAAIDARYQDWADEVGVPVGSVRSPAEKSDLIHELDALVSLLYGLSERQVEHVFATFHRGWDYRPRLDAVLEHYATWKGSA
ncbi:Eco57I restriction-modification methylase domain-containing protein [uncultured Amnibacterium sp.]|uniref:Eco57I restriction-modification methylase domain-containing protein n=1 Tax=uncultured Amnibacterium sp. TaxID=1631851 RepID=UPI0035CA534B